MAVLPKPFNASQKILRSIFKGKPSIFSAEDVNRQFDVISTFQTLLSKSVGMVRENWQITVNSLTQTIAGPNTTVNYNFTLSQILGGGRYVYYNGVRFDIPTQNFTGSIVVPTNNLHFYVYLIAKKVTVTFGDDPIMSGISSTEYPTQLPSSDTVLYKDERLQVANSAGTGIVLAPNEQVIGVIASFVEDIKTAYDGSDNGLDTKTFGVRYNALTIADILAMVPFDDTILLNSKDYKTNNSVLDALVRVIDYMKQNLTKQNAKIGGMRDDITLLVNDVATALLLGNNNAAQIASLITQLGALATAITTKADIAQETWHQIGSVGEPAFTNGWFGQAGLPPSFMKNTIGEVWLRGSATQTAIQNDTLFTLPAGYRPAFNELFICPWSPVSLQSYPGNVGVRVEVRTNGEVVAIDNGDAFFNLGGNGLCLSPIKFRAV